MADGDRDSMEFLLYGSRWSVPRREKPPVKRRPTESPASSHRNLPRLPLAASSGPPPPPGLCEWTPAPSVPIQFRAGKNRARPKRTPAKELARRSRGDRGAGAFSSSARIWPRYMTAMRSQRVRSSSSSAETSKMAQPAVARRQQRRWIDSIARYRRRGSAAPLEAPAAPSCRHYSARARAAFAGCRLTAPAPATSGPQDAHRTFATAPARSAATAAGR